MKNVIRRNVRSRKCPFGELSFGELSVGEVFVGQMSSGNCPSGKCPSGNCPRTISTLFQPTGPTAHWTGFDLTVFNTIYLALINLTVFIKNNKH